MFDLCQCTQRKRERDGRGASFSEFLEFQRGGEKVREFSLEGGLNGRWRVDARER